MIKWEVVRGILNELLVGTVVEIDTITQNLRVRVAVVKSCLVQGLKVLSKFL